MKILLIVALVIAALFLASNYLKTGEIGFNTTLSDSEREIRKLDERLSDAMRSYRVAGRGSSIGGFEDGSSAEASLGAVRGVERQMQSLKQRVREEREKERFEALEGKLREAKRLLGIS
jgi:hypothetical protein